MRHAVFIPILQSIGTHFLVVPLAAAYSCGMATLTTDWIKVAQSGPTCDGRTIAPQELRDIAETYSPATYTAVIWPDHERYYGSHGTVLAVEVRENGDVTELWAKLQPGWRMLEKNQQGQKQFASIEIWTNFGNSGRCYLGGIAITDQPASLGTEQIKLFSAKRGADAEKTRFCHCGLELPRLFTSPNTAGEGTATADEQRALSLLERTFRMFGFHKSEPDSEEPMDAKQFKEFTDRLEALDKKVTALSVAPADDAAAQDAAAGTAEAAAATESKAAGTPAEAAPEGFSAAQLGDQLSSLTKTVETLADKFGIMAQRMEGEQGSGQQFETSGPAGDAADLL